MLQSKVAFSSISFTSKNACGTFLKKCYSPMLALELPKKKMLEKTRGRFVLGGDGEVWQVAFWEINAS